MNDKTNIYQLDIWVPIGIDSHNNLYHFVIRHRVNSSMERHIKKTSNKYKARN
jgi:hypothetical protein